MEDVDGLAAVFDAGDDGGVMAEGHGIGSAGAAAFEFHVAELDDVAGFDVEGFAFGFGGAFLGFDVEDLRAPGVVAFFGTVSAAAFGTGGSQGLVGEASAFAVADLLAFVLLAESDDLIAQGLLASWCSADESGCKAR